MMHCLKDLACPRNERIRIVIVNFVHRGSRKKKSMSNADGIVVREGPLSEESTAIISVAPKVEKEECPSQFYRQTMDSQWRRRAQMVWRRHQSPTNEISKIG